MYMQYTVHVYTSLRSKRFCGYIIGRYYICFHGHHLKTGGEERGRKQGGREREETQGGREKILSANNFLFEIESVIIETCMSNYKV